MVQPSSYAQTSRQRLGILHGRNVYDSAIFVS